MRTFVLLAILCSGSLAHARLIPHHRMDSFAFMADAVILCEERKLRLVEEKHQNGFTTHRTTATCKVLRSWKGDLAVGTELDLEYSSLFVRQRFGDLGSTGTRPPSLPAGKAVMFLQRKPGGTGYRVITAKLIHQGEVLEFRQLCNPGPLHLLPQSPENLKLKAGEKYTEAVFLRDVQLAIEASKSLKKAVQAASGKKPGE